MAVTISVTGGSWNTTGAWLLGVIPTAADDVVATAASGALTVTAASVCRSFDLTGYTSTVSGSGDLSIGDGSGGACKLAGTISGTWTTTFVSTSNNGGTGWGITCGGKAFPGAVTVNGVGNKMVLQDAFTCSANAFTVTSGAFFANGQTMTTGNFVATGATTRTVDLTNSTVTISTGASAWAAASGGLTFVSTGSTITMSNGLAGFTGGGLSYGTVTFTGPAGAAVGGTNTFVNLTITGAAAKTASLSLNANQTVTGTFTPGGNTTQGVNRLLVTSNTRGTARTLTMTGAAVVISGDVDFMDITITGSPSWTNSGSKFVGDCGGNSGLTITVAATQTATGTASFTWSTHGWTSRVPLPQDTVSIPNAFVASRVITVDMPRLGADISFAGGSGSPTLTNSVANESYGSLTMVTGVAPSGSNAWTLAGRGTHTLTSAGATFTQAVIQNGPSGTYTLQDAFADSRSVSGSLTLTNGTLVDNGQTVTLSGALGAFVMSAGTLTKTAAWSFGTTNAQAFVSVTGGTITDSSSWTLTATSANTRTFAGGGKTYGTLTYTVAGSTGQLTITGSNTFSIINFSDATNARTLALTINTTTTITGSINGIVGTSGKKMSVVSTAGGTTATITKIGNLVSTDYLTVTDVVAAGVTPFYGGANSNGTGTFTNWTFTAPPGFYVGLSGNLPVTVGQAVKRAAFI